MKQILVTLPIIVSLFFLNACDHSDKDLNNENQEGQIIRFQMEASGFEVSTENANTRLDVEGCEFEDGDEIGLFAVKRKKTDSATDDDLKSTEDENFIHNARLTYSSFRGEWFFDAPFSYLADAGIVYDFYAYYPYQENLDPTAMNVNGVLDNQEGRSTLGKSDLMTAYERGHVYEEGVVRLKFDHYFSLIKFDVLPPEGNSSPFADVAFNTPAYSIKEFKLIPVALGKENLAYTKEGKNILIGMHQLDNKATYQVLVIPQIITGDTPLFYYGLSDNKEDNGLFSISSKNLITNDNGGFRKGKRYKFSYNYKP
ncbi:hypothetical protein EZS27_024311 [termite gut metagenome]|uniref:Fimbrillin family protein n=1 Tax=termite gut metagenome TaxID=433724 RepID=A0A5J4QY40_9ZZZZ